MFMPKRDTMHLRSNTRHTAVFIVIVLFCAAISGQQQPQTNTAQSGVHREGTDNILVDQYGVPLEDQSGKSIPQQAPPQQAATTAGTGNAPAQPGSTANIPSAPQ